MNTRENYNTSSPLSNDEQQHVSSPYGGGKMQGSIFHLLHTIGIRGFSKSYRELLNKQKRDK